jgi:methylmalonyl-CoA mutase, C-terminal domain
MHDRPLLRAQAREGAPGACFLYPRGEDSQRAQHQVSADPGRLDGEPGGRSRHPTGVHRETPPTAMLITRQDYCGTTLVPVAAEQRNLGDAGSAEPARDSAPLRIVVAKPGLDGHDRGAKVVARALRDAGMEVIYTGLHQTPEQIVRTALAEDADAIGLSVLSGAHMTLFARLVDLLKAERADDIVVFGGGIIPEADRAPLSAMGVAAVFTPGSSMAEVVDWVRANVRPHGTATS